MCVFVQQLAMWCMDAAEATDHCQPEGGVDTSIVSLQGLYKKHFQKIILKKTNDGTTASVTSFVGKYISYICK